MFSSCGIDLNLDISCVPAVKGTRYVNDLPDRLSADSLLYAEDVKLIPLPIEIAMIFPKAP